MLAYLQAMLSPSGVYVGQSWGYVGPSWGYVGLCRSYVGRILCIYVDMRPFPSRNPLSEAKAT